MPNPKIIHLFQIWNVHRRNSSPYLHFPSMHLDSTGSCAEQNLASISLKGP
jgi:hypothetical protein